MFLAYFRQFKIRRMFTLQLQRQKSKKLRPWERSHWKADEIFLLLEGGQSLYLNYNMSQNYSKVQSLKKKLVQICYKKFEHLLKCRKLHQLSNETIPKVVAACFFVAGAVE